VLVISPREEYNVEYEYEITITIVRLVNARTSQRNNASKKRKKRFVHAISMD
jgi:hypothetical protein